MPHAGRWCEQHKRWECTSHRKDGTDCHGSRVNGADKCRMHLGKKTDVVKLEQQARAAVVRLGFEPVEDPLSVLASVAGEFLSIKDFLRGKTEELDALTFESVDGVEQIRAILAAYQQALRDSMNVLATMAKLGIDERLAKITEARATAIIVVFTEACDAAGIEGEQRDRFFTAADEAFARQSGAIL